MSSARNGLLATNGHIHSQAALRERRASEDPRPNGSQLPAKSLSPTDELEDLKARIRTRPETIEAQHSRGKLTARERLDLLFDRDTFTEIGMLRRHDAHGFGLEHKRFPTDGVVTGWGTVDGRPVFAFAHDFTLLGGSLGKAFASKIQRLMDLALASGAPIIALNDGAGARIQEGIDALDGYGGIFSRNVNASGVVPQISVIAGPCAGGAAYSPALTDFVFMVADTANMFVTGPDVVRTVTGEQVTAQTLGGAAVHSTTSGVASFVAGSEQECLEEVRLLLSYLPSNNLDEPPSVEPNDDPHRACDRLREIVPDDPHQPYDIRDVITEIVDDGAFLEISESWARSIVCVFARLDGQVVGMVGNQPQVMAGTLDIHSSEKAARFVRTCDAFNIPLVTLVDVPGFLPGTMQEHNGLIRRGAKLLYAYCEATIPRVQVILRKAYGGAYIVMDSKSIGADLSFAWPRNEVAVMGAEPAVDLLYRKELRQPQDGGARRRELIAEYRLKLMNPYVAVEQGHVDDVIAPHETRAILIRSLAMLRTKRKGSPARKHGNIPL